MDDFGARPRDDDVEVFDAGVVFSTGVASFEPSRDGVEARESLSLDAVSVSGFFDFDAGTGMRTIETQVIYLFNNCWKHEHV